MVLYTGAFQMPFDLQYDIGHRLRRDQRSRSLARRIINCQAGGCEQCGDLCPVKAAKWLEKHAEAVELALTANVANPVWHITFVRDLWNKEPGLLEHCSVDAVKKSIRRSLDALRQPATVAVGHVDAWYAWKKWEIGATLLVVGPDKNQLCDVFPAQILSIEKIERSAVPNNLKRTYRAKRSVVFAANNEPPKKRRGEYYAWLASIAPGCRLIRYGIDRHFNLLAKSAKPIRVKEVKRKKYPVQLIPYMFDNHPPGCQCEPCGGLGKFYRNQG